MNGLVIQTSQGGGGDVTLFILCLLDSSKVLDTLEEFLFWWID
jgi:hypothetical protein